MKYITYKFRAYPNKTQQKLFYLTFLMCRYMFNTLLKLTLDNYSLFCQEIEDKLKQNENFDEEEFNKSHKLPSIATLKTQDDRYKQVDSLALCNEFFHLKRGLEMFYRGNNSKMPHFKKRKDKNSYTTNCVNNNIRVEGSKIRLPKVGFVKVRGMRDIPNHFKIKQARVFEDKTGKFYIYLVFEYEELQNTDSANTNITTPASIVGLDFKIGDIFVSSDNFIPKYDIKYSNFLDKVPFIQKIVNRKKKFSKNYWKAINKLRRFHRKIVNMRKNMLHLISTKLQKQYNTVIIENLSIKEIVYKLGRGKNAYNTSFNLFTKILSYKFNGNIIKIDKWFPSSKTCSNCSNIKKHLKLAQRVYRCNICGNTIDRDLNAAINIRNEGIRILNQN